MPDHSPSTDDRASLAQPSQSSSPLECTSHLGSSLVKELLSETAVERHDESIVCGLSGTADIQRHSIQVGPLVEALGGEVRPIVPSAQYPG